MTLLKSGGDGAATAAQAPLAPLPVSRRRRGIQRVAIWAILLAGLAMLTVALVSMADAASVGLTAVAGTIVVGVAGASVAEVMRPRAVGILALAIGIICVITALVPESFAVPEAARLVGGLTMVVASLPLLPREPQVAAAVKL